MRFARVAAVAGAVVLLLICLITWQSVLDTKMEVRDLRDELHQARVAIETINTITGDIHTFTYKTMSDLDVDRAKAGKTYDDLPPGARVVPGVKPIRPVH